MSELMTIPDLYSQLNIEERLVSLSKEEAELIYIILTQTEVKKTLEIGFAYGCSAAYIISATNSIHYAIDAKQEERWNNLGIKNLEKLKLDHHLRLQHDWSHNALPELLKQGLKFDFVLIDGDHKFDGIMNDFYYVDLLLNFGGYVLFDDLYMKSTQIVVNWITTNRLDYKQIDLPDGRVYGNFALFQKVDIDERTWEHFNEFRNEECPYKYDH